MAAVSVKRSIATIVIEELHRQFILRGRYAYSPNTASLETLTHPPG